MLNCQPTSEEQDQGVQEDLAENLEALRKARGLDIHALMREIVRS